MFSPKKIYQPYDISSNRNVVNELFTKVNNSKLLYNNAVYVSMQILIYILFYISILL